MSELFTLAWKQAIWGGRRENAGLTGTIPCSTATEYGGLHCGETFDVMVGGRWRPTRIVTWPRTGIWWESMPRPLRPAGADLSHPPAC